MSSQNHWDCQKELYNASADFLAANQKQWTSSVQELQIQKNSLDYEYKHISECF
jgi:hypothetical protein